MPDEKKLLTHKQKEYLQKEIRNAISRLQRICAEEMPEPAWVEEYRKKIRAYESVDHPYPARIATGRALEERTDKLFGDLEFEDGEACRKSVTELVSWVRSQVERFNGERQEEE